MTHWSGEEEAFGRLEHKFWLYITHKPLRKGHDGTLMKDSKKVRCQIGSNRSNFSFLSVRGQFNVSGIGGPEKHIINASVYSPPPKVPIDCNTKGDRKGIEWYPHTGMACLARRSDCETPGFPVEETENTYSTQQECMDAHFANWRMSYKMNCMKGFAPITIDDVPLVFSKTLCDSPHHSDVCNRDEYCVFSNRTKYGFCCHRSQANSAISYTVYGKNFHHHRQRRRVKLVVV
ncbi:hypothetical protein Y032_0001g453 [Ancylostoma ceylanicum]|uniref:Uncharacterized protein n=1 Tax=Ancylostoma ceylanicum TaxID=53326 RepID=A0A016W4I7_9BILA|nr:hypothetical protein Y032_0001g453 [Ancylostoma ceylanicum]